MAAMGLLRRWRRRKRDKEAEERALAEMRRADEPPVAQEPAEVKLSQLRD